MHLIFLQVMEIWRLPVMTSKGYGHAYILQWFLLQFHFLQIFHPKQPTGYNKGKRLLKWEKVKSRAGRTTTQPRQGTLNTLRTV